MADNDQLDRELNELTQTLRTLDLESRRIRRRSNQVQDRIRTLQSERRRRTFSRGNTFHTRRDRHGDKLDIGDYVNFLTVGKFNTRGGTVTGISNVRFVSARDSEGRIINREPANVEIVRKFDKDHDRRERL